MPSATVTAPPRATRSRQLSATPHAQPPRPQPAQATSTRAWEFARLMFPELLTRDVW